MVCVYSQALRRKAEDVARKLAALSDLLRESKVRVLCTNWSIYLTTCTCTCDNSCTNVLGYGYWF